MHAIATVLAGERLDALHLVAHGQAGGICLGGQWIDAQALRDAAPLLAQWQVGSIALWSCEAGADPELVDTLARLTGARVHAARGRLGATQAGRNWTLEGQGEPIAPPFAPHMLHQWPHELASFTFSKVYQVTSTVDKETNSHTFNTTALNSGSTGAVADGISSRLFSGNDLSVTLTIGATTVHGWISRPIKVGGQVVGFYLWSDASFTSLAAAQAGGNNDPDSLTSNNTGYVLVVPGKESYFTSGTVGSSSDRVDSALNSVIPVNAAPVAVADESNTALAAGASGGPALEAGAGVSTVNAIGNVLSNDTDTNSGDTKAVSMVGTSAASTAVTAGTTSADGTQVVGAYGTLTIGADGSYSYAVANSNTAVQALRTTANTLSDVFTYRMKDSEGATSTTTLTVKITGANDAPSANADYNSAKESLSGASTFTGFSATGNVLTNDTDVDSGDGKSIVGISQTASATVGAVSVSTGSTKLTFLGASGFNSVSSGQAAYVKLSTDSAGDNYRGLFYSSNGTTFSQVTVSTSTLVSTDNYDIVLSQTPTHYYSVTSGAGTYTSIANFTTFLTSHTDVLFESSSANTENDNGGKRATVSSSTGTGYTDITTLSSITGSVVDGMTVTGTGVPNGTTVTSVTYTSGAITSIRLSSELTSTSGGAFTFSKAVSSGVSYTGAHGSVTIGSNGNYTYTPTSNNTKLAGGESAVEKFDYTMQDTLGQQSTSTLYITVYGASATDPVASNDTDSATEAGTASGVNPTGNLRTNDTASTTVAGAQASTATSETSIGTDTTVAGAYGNLTLSSGGGYTYTVTNSNATVDALRAVDTLTETFYYRLTDTDPATSDSVAKLTITITGANDAPVANTDTVDATEDASASTGNVLSNDTDVDTSDTRTVASAVVGTSSSFVAGDAVSSGSTSTSGGKVLTGTYGTLTIGANGTYSYAVSTTDLTIQALGSSSSPVTDIFSYQVKDASNATAYTTLTVSIYGANDAPQNTVSSTRAVEAGGTLTFTGGNAISVSDVDGNIDTVTVSVESGSITVSVAGGASIVNGASGTSTLTLTGTQAQINAALATLQYTPISGFTGADYLTVYSNDTNKTYDNDVVTIQVMSVNDITVNEASPFGVFTVRGEAGVSVALALVETSGVGYANIAETQTLKYWNASTSTWANYNGTSVAIPTGGVLLVRASITAEADTTAEVDEVFDLKVTYGGVDFSGTATIVDDGNGTIYPDSNPTNSSTPATVTTASSLDDDRALSVNSIEVNEGSQYAVFEVTGAANQLAQLSLTNGTATKGSTTPTDGSVDLSSTLQYWDGSAWQDYTASSYVSLPASGPLYVRMAIVNDTANEGDQTFTLTASNTGGTGADGTGTIDDRGGGVIYTFNGGGTSGAPNGTSTSGLNDDRTVSVGSITVNEASPYAVFSVSGTAGDSVALTLVEGSGAGYANIDETQTLQYWNASTSAWASYNGTSVTIPSGDVLLVRVGITPERDTANEADETFRLKATFSGTDYFGTATIVDDGNGTIYPDANPTNSSTPATNTTAADLDDDRALSVNSIEVNEGSSYGVFEVTGVAGQLTRLTLTDVTAIKGASTPTDGSIDYSSTLQYWDGSVWQTYTANSYVSLPASGPLYVRMAIVNDTANEGDQTFTLTASNTGGTGADGTGTIDDRGGGVIYTFNGGGTSGAPNGTSTSGLNNDQSGLTLGAISGNTSEAGTSATFTVRLATQPTHSVTITVSSGDTTEGSLSPTTLTFTTSNWNTNQTVTVTGVDDSDVDGDIAYQVGLSVSSTDADYNGRTGSVPVTNTDNDVAASPTGDLVLGAVSGNTSEAGGTSTFTVRLSAAPTQNVVVTIASRDTTEGTVGPTTLVFTPSDWNTPQTVTITGVDDPVPDGDIPYQVDLSTSSTDSGFSGKTGTVSLINLDNDGPQVSSAEVNEASPWAVWTIQAGPGSRLDLGLSGTASGGGVDRGPDIEYSTDGGATWSSGSPTVPAGGSLLARVPVVEDFISDNGETMVLTATDNRGQSGAGTVTINDQGGGAIYDNNGAADPGRTRTDDRPQVDVSSVTVSEASPYAVVSVSLSNPSTVPISFSPRLVSGTATVGTDTGGGLEYFSGGSWLPVSGPIVLPPGALSVQLRVAIQTDALTNEGAETFRIETGPITGGVRNPDGVGGVVTITDMAVLRDPVITDVTETPTDPTPSDLLTADTTQVVQVRGEPGCEVRLFRLDFDGTPQAVPAPAFVKTETSGLYTLDFGGGVLNTGEYVVQLVRDGYTSGYSNSFTIDSTPGLYDITGRREVVRIDATTSYTNGAVGGMDQNRLPTYWNGTDWLDSDGQRIRFTVDSLATFDKDAVPGAIWTTATATSGSTLKLNSQTGAYIYTPVRDATVDQFVLFASDGGKGASLTLTLDARDTLDRDGIPAGVESTLATAAGGNASLADLNNDGIIDAQQNAVTTMAWTTFGVFSDSLASQPVATSAVVAVQAVLSNSGSAIDDSMQLFNVKVLSPTSPAVGGSKPDNAVWDPIQFGIEPLQSMGLRDADPGRDGIQVRILIDISRSGVTEGSFAGYMKYVSAEAVAAGVRDLDGRPITQPGWYDFTQRTEGADGARFIAQDGFITAIELNLTDNAFGDNDMTVGRLFDPGVPVSQPPARPVYATDLASQDKLWQLSPPGGPAPEIAFYATTAASPASLPLVAWRNTLTGDLFYAPEGVAPPYACYVQVEDAPSLGRVLPVGQGAFDVHLYLRASDGITQEMGQAQAQAQGLLQKGFVDLGALFASAPSGGSVPQVAAAVTAPLVDLVGTQTLWDW